MGEADETAVPSCLDSTLVQAEPGNKPSCLNNRWTLGQKLLQYLEKIDDNKANCTEEAERLKSRQDGGAPDGEGQEVSQRGDGDGAARPGHGQTEPLLQRPSAVGGAEVVETLHGDEHVVDADAEEEEGDDVVEGAVREAAKAAEAVSKAN